MAEYIVRLIVCENDSSRGKVAYVFLFTNMDNMQEASKFYWKHYKIEICFKYLLK